MVDKFFIKNPRLRRLVTSILETDRDLDIEMVGSLMRINSRREHGYLRAFRLSRSSAMLRDELATLMNLFSVVRDGDTFIDVGANVGDYSVELIKAGITGKLFLVDPLNKNLSVANQKILNLNLL